MQQEPTFARKITNNMAKIRNSKTTGTALVITVATMILLSSSIVGVVSVWADNFFGTSGPDTMVGTDDDDTSKDSVSSFFFFFATSAAGLATYY